MDAGKEPCVTFLGGGRLHLVTDGYDLAGVKLLQLEQVRHINSSLLTAGRELPVST